MRRILHGDWSIRMGENRSEHTLKHLAGMFVIFCDGVYSRSEVTKSPKISQRENCLREGANSVFVEFGVRGRGPRFLMSLSSFEMLTLAFQFYPTLAMFV